MKISITYSKTFHATHKTHVRIKKGYRITRWNRVMKFILIYQHQVPMNFTEFVIGSS